MNSETIRNKLSVYRTELIGFSILWIFLHHSAFFGMCQYGMFDTLIKIGSCGVDVFLLLSAFGLFGSLKRNANILQFYKRRIIRIVPTFLIIVCLFHLKQGLGYLLSYDTWYWELYSNWYILFIGIAYAVYPVLFKVQKKYLLLPIILLSLLSLFGTILLVLLKKDNIHDLPMLMVQRLPVFAIGMLLADERVDFSIKHIYGMFMVLCWVLCLIVKYHIDVLLYPLYALFALTICAVLTCFFEKWGGKLFYYLGTISLELYLVHMKLMPMFVNHSYQGWLFLLIVFVISCIISYAIHWGMQKVFAKK